MQPIVVHCSRLRKLQLANSHYSPGLPGTASQTPKTRMERHGGVGQVFLRSSNVYFKQTLGGAGRVMVRLRGLSSRRHEPQYQMEDTATDGNAGTKLASPSDQISGVGVCASKFTRQIDARNLVPGQLQASRLGVLPLQPATPLKVRPLAPKSAWTTPKMVVLSCIIALHPAVHTVRKTRCRSTVLVQQRKVSEQGGVYNFKVLTCGS